jgi:DNA-binding NarL/FixJ family response regulator
MTSLRERPRLDLPPAWIHRILTLQVAQWSFGKIVDLGRHQGTWDEQTVVDVLTAHGRTVLGMPGTPEYRTHGGRPIPVNPTQHAVLTLLLEDTSDETIAATLGISVKVVQKHIRTVCQKAELRDRTSLVLALTSGRVRAVDLDDSHD